MNFYSYDFIISTLNIEVEQIQICDIVVKDNTIHFKVTLKNNHPTCPVYARLTAVSLCNLSLPIANEPPGCTGALFPRPALPGPQP